jgi:hypothetical protein
MHPPRRNRATDRLGLSDRLADWLLTHCPFFTLTLLTLLVVGTPLTVSRLAVFLVPVAAADVLLNVGRHVRRVRKSAHAAHAAHAAPPSVFRPGAAA